MSHSRERQHELAEQPSLFFPEAPVESARREPPPVAQIPSLGPASTLSACALPYGEYLRRTDHSVYTVTCFLSDLRMFVEYAGRETPLRTI